MLMLVKLWSAMYLWCVALLIFPAAHCLASKQHQHSRSKRHLVFPVGGGIFKLVVGIGVPTKLGIKQSMAVGANFQFQYRIPPDIRDVTKPFPPLYSDRRRRRRRAVHASGMPSDRTLFYMGLEAAMSRYGLNGRACMLRMICDNAMHTLKHESNGLFGELIHIALTPESPDSDRKMGEDNVYVDAQRAGEYGVDCTSLYPACPSGENLLDVLSVLDN